MTKEEAFDIIKSNPGCVAELDNDCWHIRKPRPNNWNAMTEDEQESWLDDATLIWSLDVEECDYGGGLVEVLALAFDMKVESV
jgi:hypothetical protein